MYTYFRLAITTIVPAIIEKLFMIFWIAACIVTFMQLYISISFIQTWNAKMRFSNIMNVETSYEYLHLVWMYNISGRGFFILSFSFDWQPRQNGRQIYTRNCEKNVGKYLKRKCVLKPSKVLAKITSFLIFQSFQHITTNVSPQEV